MVHGVVASLAVLGFSVFAGLIGAALENWARETAFPSPRIFIVGASAGVVAWVVSHWLPPRAFVAVLIVLIIVFLRVDRSAEESRYNL